MSYRKLVINEKTYEYVIGKSHTRIKGIGVFLNNDIGSRYDILCECCGTPLSELYNDLTATENRVTPSDIKTMILKTISPVTY
jgi:hypothetical protein